MYPGTGVPEYPTNDGTGVPEGQMLGPTSEVVTLIQSFTHIHCTVGKI